MPDESDGRPREREYRDVDVSEQQWGSDVVADVLKAYGFEYVSYNPGASFRGIEESLVNYNDDVPQTIEVANEGLSVAVAHGYAKAADEPALCILHDSVGTLNGSMGIFNAYVDQVPILILSGNGPLRKSKRRPWIDWIHSNHDQGSLVRDFIKWFDEPVHSDGVVESIIRGVNIADTPRKGPVYITIDHELQENSLEEPYEIPDLEKHQPPSRMAPDPEMIERAADMLVEAERPAILADRVGTSREAVEALADLAETLGAPVVHSRKKHRFNVPTTHPLYLDGLHEVPDTDLLLALDVVSPNLFLNDADTATHEKTPVLDGDPALIDVGTHDIDASSLIGDYYALCETDLPILADTALAIPALLDAVEERLDADDAARRRAEERFEEVGEIHDAQRARWAEQAEAAADETPIAVSRLASDLWNLIEDEQWAIVNGTLAGWTHRLWEIEEYDQYIGGASGGGGVGYGVGAAIGAALAFEGSGRVPINLQADGDLMQFSSGLWTMARYDVPLFTVVHNNGTLYNSTNHRMKLAELRGRDASFERAMIGTGLDDPTPDYATLAESFGVSGYGPVEDPGEVAPTLERAWADVQAGNPVLVDVVCQPR